VNGVTPLAAIDEARAAGAATVFVTCGAAAPDAADVVVAVAVGPEVVAGSTRLKAGTATKLVLNAVSTAAMVRLGKVYRGRMVDIRATTAKLRARALRTLRDLGGVDAARAERLLDEAGGQLRPALAAALTGAPVGEAMARLAAAGGRLGALVRGSR
jgi:N-acetylmuramic acid 6-phosphate etherase